MFRLLFIRVLPLIPPAPGYFPWRRAARRRAPTGRAPALTGELRQ
ncbi:MAG: hypothetical protein V3T27_02675 [Alphaproteobacteria bacterium]